MTEMMKAEHDTAVVRELTAEEALALFRQLSEEEKREVIAFMEGLNDDRR